MQHARKKSSNTRIPSYRARISPIKTRFKSPPDNTPITINGREIPTNYFTPIAENQEEKTDDIFDKIVGQDEYTIASKKVESKEPKVDAAIPEEPGTDITTPEETIPSSDIEVESKSTSMRDYGTNHKPASRRDSKVDSKPASRRDSKVDSKPASRRDSKVDSKPASRRDSKVDYKPASRRDSKVDSRRDSLKSSKPPSRKSSKSPSRKDSPRRIKSTRHSPHRIYIPERSKSSAAEFELPKLSPKRVTSSPRRRRRKSPIRRRTRLHKTEIPYKKKRKGRTIYRKKVRTDTAKARTAHILPNEEDKEYFRELTEDDEMLIRVDYELKFRKLMGAFPELKIKIPEEEIPLTHVHALYMQYLRTINITQGVVKYRLMLMAYFAILQYVASFFFGKQVTGFAKSQMDYISFYDPLLYELGEKYGATGDPLGNFPVEVRILFYGIIHCVVFIVVNWVANKFGDAIGGVAESIGNSIRSGNLSLADVVDAMANNKQEEEETANPSARNVPDPPKKSNGGGFDFGSIISNFMGMASKANAPQGPTVEEIPTPPPERRKARRMPQFDD
jgi:hypothetical protein